VYTLRERRRKDPATKRFPQKKVITPVVRVSQTVRNRIRGVISLVLLDNLLERGPEAGTSFPVGRRPCVLQLLW
jgi:hypothetical protein